MGRWQFHSLSYDYVCVLCNKHTLHLFKLLLVRSVGLLQWILISFFCFYVGYCEFWSKWIKWTNIGEIISVRQHICMFYWQKYLTDTDYIFYSALHNGISLDECNLAFFCRHTFLKWSWKLLFTSDTVQVTVKMGACHNL